MQETKYAFNTNNATKSLIWINTVSIHHFFVLFATRFLGP